MLFAVIMRFDSLREIEAAMMVRIVMMYCINLESFFNQPDADLKIMLAEASESPPSEAENP